MIRLLGALLITGGTAGWGLASVVRLRKRVTCLQALVSALAAMTSEICDRLTPMPELLAAMSREATYPASEMFKRAEAAIPSIGSMPFSLIWQQAVRNTPELLLAPEEELVLTELGLCLGRYDVSEQRSALQYARRRLEDFVRKAESDRDRNSKVRAYLGFSVGLFAIIILI